MTLVVGVPGPWADRAALSAAIAEGTNGAFVLAGPMLVDVAGEDHILVEVRGRDERLRHAFELASGGRLDDATLAAIDAHAQTVYLFDEGGSSFTARRLLRFARAIVDGGGVAVKVESSGVAHSSASWKRLELASASPAALYEAFVVLIASDLSTWSCGMRHLGLPDAVTSGPRVEANALLTGFLQYLAAEDPPLDDGDTFALGEGRPSYRLSREECVMYDADDLFHNPYGLWRLSRV